MLPVIIREMKEEDLGAVASIEVESFTAPWSVTSFMEELGNPRSKLRVAEYNGEVVGYICLSLVHDEGHILDLAVCPLYRNLGVAKALVENGLTYLREHGCLRVFLEVRASNKSALGLYRRFGFKVSARRKDYYRTPREDAIVMTLDFPQ